MGGDGGVDSLRHGGMSFGGLVRPCRRALVALGVFGGALVRRAGLDPIPPPFVRHEVTVDETCQT